MEVIKGKSRENKYKCFEEMITKEQGKDHVWEEDIGQEEDWGKEEECLRLRRL